jgi:hypothetical protein
MKYPIINFLAMRKNLFFLIFAISVSSFGQQILLDKPLRAGDLTLFPELNNETVYYYLPDKVRIGKHPDGKPQFSFLRYVENVRSANETREGDGGGIVHAVIELKVPDEMLAKARQELRRLKSNAIIQGPIVYKGGTIALISSFTDPASGFTKKVIGLGKAPILDNEKAAISVLLTKQGAKILWESFKTPTPDMSISFEMEVTGFRSPIGATIEANFDQIYTHQSFQAAIATPVLAGEINQAFDDLVKTGAIKVTQVGTDANIERAVEAAYTKLTNMMFDPAGGSGTPNLNQLTGSGGQPSMLDRATTMLNTARTETRQENERRRTEALEELRSSETIANRNRPARTVPDTSETMTFGASSGMKNASNEEMNRIEEVYNRRRNLIEQTQVSPPALAIAFSYEMRRVRQQGIFRIDLNKYNTDNLVMRFDENFGQIDCQTCFRQVNIDDPLYQQREISTFLDGANSSDFDKYINSVTVSMRKKHGNGDVTNDEVRIDRKNLNAEGNNFKMLYGWKGDDNRLKWLDYEYKTDWFFFGGYKSTSEWIKNTNSTIPLSSPFLRKIISIEADPDLIKKENVRAIEVKVYSKIGDFQQSKDLRLNVKNQQFAGQLELIQSKDSSDFEYEYTWYLSDGSSKKSGKKSSTSSLLFVDTI